MAGLGVSIITRALNKALTSVFKTLFSTSDYAPLYAGYTLDRDGDKRFWYKFGTDPEQTPTVLENTVEKAITPPATDYQPYVRDQNYKEYLKQTTATNLVLEHENTNVTVAPDVVTLEDTSGNTERRWKVKEVLQLFMAAKTNSNLKDGLEINIFDDDGNIKNDPATLTEDDVYNLIQARYVAQTQGIYVANTAQIDELIQNSTHATSFNVASTQTDVQRHLDVLTGKGQQAAHVPKPVKKYIRDAQTTSETIDWDDLPEDETEREQALEKAREKLEQAQTTLAEKLQDVEAPPIKSKNQLQKELTNTSNDINIQEQSLQSVKDRTAALEQEIIDLGQEHNSLEKENNAFKTSLNDKISKRDEFEKKQKKGQKRLDYLKSQLGQKKKDRNEERTKKDLNTEIDKLEEKQNKRLNKIQNLNKEIKNDGQVQEESHKKLLTLEDTIEEKEDALKTAQQNEQEITGELQALSEQTKQLKTELAFAEQITPVSGAAYVDIPTKTRRAPKSRIVEPPSAPKLPPEEEPPAPPPEPSPKPDPKGSNPEGKRGPAPNLKALDLDTFERVERLALASGFTGKDGKTSFPAVLKKENFEKGHDFGQYMADLQSLGIESATWDTENEQIEITEPTDREKLGTMWYESLFAKTEAYERENYINCLSFNDSYDEDQYLSAEKALGMTMWIRTNRDTGERYVELRDESDVDKIDACRKKFGKPPLDREALKGQKNTPTNTKEFGLVNGEIGLIQPEGRGKGDMTIQSLKAAHPESFDRIEQALFTLDLSNINDENSLVAVLEREHFKNGQTTADYISDLKALGIESAKWDYKQDCIEITAQKDIEKLRSIQQHFHESVFANADIVRRNDAFTIAINHNYERDLYLAAGEMQSISLCPMTSDGEVHIYIQDPVDENLDKIDACRKKFGKPSLDREALKGQGQEQEQEPEAEADPEEPPEPEPEPPKPKATMTEAEAIHIIERTVFGEGKDKGTNERSIRIVPNKTEKEIATKLATAMDTLGIEHYYSTWNNNGNPIGTFLTVDDPKSLERIDTIKKDFSTALVTSVHGNYHGEDLDYIFINKEKLPAEVSLDLYKNACENLGIKVKIEEKYESRYHDSRYIVIDDKQSLKNLAALQEKHTGTSFYQEQASFARAIRNTGLKTTLRHKFNWAKKRVDGKWDIDDLKNAFLSQDFDAAQGTLGLQDKHKIYFYRAQGLYQNITEEIFILEENTKSSNQYIYRKPEDEPFLPPDDLVEHDPVLKREVEFSDRLYNDNTYKPTDETVKQLKQRLIDLNFALNQVFLPTVQNKNDLKAGDAIRELCESLGVEIDQAGKAPDLDNKPDDPANE